MKNKGIAKSQIKIRAFNKDRLDGELLHMLFLSAFYGLETAKLFGWTVEHRYRQLTHFQYMLRAGYSRMHYAVDKDGMPMGMLITTKTDKPKIKRMDALYVFDKFRGQGVAGMLLKEARGNCDLHSFSAPSAVDWHLNNGFRLIGPNEQEGTLEMFTGNYKPVYGFSYAMPMQTDYDRSAIQQLEEMERQALSGLPGLPAKSRLD
ncbi:TPA: GNAT family N-acetyltransferase [Pseudomonas aeruginosa]|nr:GNAT family N-acetyltransferase [Pseudomonas aeruginosa]